ncbi:MAG: LapA family protein [Aerococcaceae bacterium]|nr:LapA family protein [Aerococcaceae bacterium]
MKQQWKLIVSLVLIICVVLFALQNTNPVQVDFFLMKQQVPLILVILASLLLGVVAGLITSLTSFHTHRKTVKKLESELQSLKTKLATTEKQLETAQNVQAAQVVQTTQAPEVSTEETSVAS